MKLNISLLLPALFLAGFHAGNTNDDLERIGALISRSWCIEHPMYKTAVNFYKGHTKRI